VLIIVHHLLAHSLTLTPTHFFHSLNSPSIPSLSPLHSPLHRVQALQRRLEQASHELTDIQHVHTHTRERLQEAENRVRWSEEEGGRVRGECVGQMEAATDLAEKQNALTMTLEAKVSVCVLSAMC
jgi:hypothetical protein